MFIRVTIVLLFLFGHSAWARANNCPNSIFAIVASIAYVEPKNPVAVRGDATRLNAGDCLFKGQEINLIDDERNNNIQRVEIFYGGDIKVLVNDKDQNHDFRVPDGVAANSKLLQELIAKTFRLPSPNALPEFRSITVTRRGESDGEGVEAENPMPLRPIISLRKLPIQFVTENTTFVYGWRGGKTPHECQSLSLAGEVISAIGAATNWCAIPLESKRPARLTVRDSLDGRYGWNIDFVKWSDVPRPGDVATPIEELSRADRAAWGMWLWQSAPNKWRLQALSMIFDGAKDSWLAGFFFRTILEEKPLMRGDSTRD